jgi:BirA family biotin operon repressor/biotin-[acetyl-CoA-carboxylase] ligase
MIKPDEIIENEGLWKGRLILFKRLKSTNTWAMENLNSCRHGDVICTVYQTKGRGRLSRSWVTPKGKCLTLSIVLNEFRADQMKPILGQVMALTVARLLENEKIPVRLKWPNDILVNGRKIAGILSESDFDNHMVILGVGINVNLDPNEVSSLPFERPITSMMMETGLPFDLEEIRKRFTEEAESILDTFALKGSDFVTKTWGIYDWLTGSRIEIRNIDGTVQGEYLGLDQQGRIRIRIPSGAELVFWSGDVNRVITVYDS